VLILEAEAEITALAFEADDLADEILEALAEPFACDAEDLEAFGAADAAETKDALLALTLADASVTGRPEKRP
jgi:hypothetical protein